MIPLFESLPSSVAEAARATLAPTPFQAGDVLVAEGAPGGNAFYVVEGRVEVVRQGVRIDESGPGELLGEMSLFTGDPSIATVRALTDGAALVIRRDDYERLADARSEVAWRIERLSVDVMARRLRRLDAIVVENAPGEASPFKKKPAPRVLDRIRAAVFGQPPAPPPVKPRPHFPIEVLYYSPLFQDIDESVRTELAENMRIEAVPPGTFLCTQGEPGDRMFILAYGAVDALVSLPGDRVHRLGTMEPGAAFGTIALVDDGPRAACCVARDKVDVLVLDRKGWKTLYDASSPAGSAMRRAVIRACAKQVTEAGGHAATML